MDDRLQRLQAALNRDRVAVEVEWLIHLTSNNVLATASAANNVAAGGPGFLGTCP